MAEVTTSAGCEACKRTPVQWFLAVLPSGFFLNSRCRDHLVEPQPRVVELAPVEALFIVPTVGSA